ncbi:MAG: D-aminoacylase [Gemmatimonadaceae bacterium]
MKLRFPLIALLATTACAQATRGADAASYDVVISGGRIVDGTGNPWTYGDVGIVADRIAAVAAPGALANAPARQRIDARGRVVAPGFIDIQAQSYDAHLFGDGRVISKISQGVTTEILGEGGTPAPVTQSQIDALAPAESVTKAMSQHFIGAHGFGAWLDAMERHGSSVNIGSYLGAENPRIIAKGYAEGRASAAELDTMRRVMRDAMRDGAFGLASALIYPPGAYASTDELAAMAEAMAPYHGVYISHIRSEDDQLLEALDEALAIGRRGGVPVEIYHLKAGGTRNWPKAAHAVAKLDSAWRAGQDVGATMYPYPASSNALSACIPSWASANDSLLANLRDPAKRARVVREMSDMTPGANQGCQLDGPSVIMVVGITRPELKKYEGWRLDRIASDLERPWPETLVDLVLAEQARVGKITFSMSDANVAMQLAQPWVIIGSDAEAHDPATAQGMTHPRAYGTFARMLGKYVRDEHVLTLEDAVRKMTSATAALLGIRDRGTLRSGMFADIVVFDPATVIDRATYERPHQLATGIDVVLVNGVAVWRDGAATNALPGRALHGPGWSP